MCIDIRCIVIPCLGLLLSLWCCKEAFIYVCLQRYSKTIFFSNLGAHKYTAFSFSQRESHWIPGLNIVHVFCLNCWSVVHLVYTSLALPIFGSCSSSLHNSLLPCPSSRVCAPLLHHGHDHDKLQFSKFQ